MKISIITVCYNSGKTIAHTLRSVAVQSFKDVEHIIIDGESTDNTLEIITAAGNHVFKVVSEPDKGIYDAMNKGIRLATGDIVGILNSDDFYANQYVLENIANSFYESTADLLFADLEYVQRHNIDKVVRYYSGASFTPSRLAWGWMPPHPTVFVRREVYERYGLFRTDYRIAADYELMARFLAKYSVKYLYFDEVILRMRTGGISTRNLKSNWILNREIIRACAENNIDTNILKVYSKYFQKIMQLFARPV
jgi:glycosyltransferase involved in cell wall biosynthesis